MQTTQTIQEELSLTKKTARERKKELKRVNDSRQAAKEKGKRLSTTVKIKSLRLQETKVSRDRWKKDYKEESKKSSLLEERNTELVKLLEESTGEVMDLRHENEEIKKKCSGRSR